VLQERIIQHNDLEKLNESSVNVVRIMTWFNGSEVIPINAELHVGGKGLFTDNQSTADGLGMTCTGLTLDGKCKGITVHPCGVRTNKSASGFTLDGYQIPGFNRMIKIAKEQHTQLPKIDFIGWDFTVDINGEVVVIEYNIKCPGVLCQQYVNGPLFGEYRTEILDKYLKKK
jgi:hypothetical protein